MNDYKISVVTTTVSDFQTDNFGEKFVYDYSKDISAQKGNENPAKMSKKQKELYNTYNMFILGFGDTFHKVNMSNKNGAIDFLKYFIASGKSVLFTHDFTSMHNVNSGDFGYSANTYLRDVMGMNRYKAVSGKLTESERKELLAYQAKHKYDTMTQTTVGSNGTLSTTALGNTQGFTYYAMKRLGWEKKNTDQIIPYRYMIRSYKNDEYGDPLINDDHAVALKLATREELAYIKETTLKINELLKEFFLSMNLKLVDFKIEFGKTADGTILLADEISPDSCRLWDVDTNQKYDKDVFRQDIGDLIETYKAVLARMQNK